MLDFIQKRFGKTKVNVWVNYALSSTYLNGILCLHTAVYYQFWYCTKGKPKYYLTLSALHVHNSQVICNISKFRANWLTFWFFADFFWVNTKYLHISWQDMKSVVCRSINETCKNAIFSLLEGKRWKLTVEAALSILVFFRYTSGRKALKLFY